MRNVFTDGREKSAVPWKIIVPALCFLAVFVTVLLGTAGIGRRTREQGRATAEEAVRRAVRLGVCNIYHGCIHNMLYDRQEEILKGLYKAASFVVQAICFLQTGKYTRKQKDLLDIAGKEEQNIVKTFLALKAGGKADLGEMSDMLLLWAQGWISRL